MELTFEGWYKETKTNIRPDIWKKVETDYTVRVEGYFTGFPIVSGVDEEGLVYRFETVKVLLYVDENGKEVCKREYIPWTYGEEIRNVDVPVFLQGIITGRMLELPISV